MSLRLLAIVLLLRPCHGNGTLVALLPHLPRQCANDLRLLKLRRHVATYGNASERCRLPGLLAKTFRARNSDLLPTARFGDLHEIPHELGILRFRTQLATMIVESGRAVLKVVAAANSHEPGRDIVRNAPRIGLRRRLASLRPAFHDGHIVARGQRFGRGERGT